MGFGVLEVVMALTAFSIASYTIFVVLFFIGARAVIGTRAPVGAEPVPTELPPVTILKPCAGADDDLEGCLESYCAQRYPRFQIVFGVRDTNDKAYPIIERVRARHPEVDIEVVLSGEGRHPSPKISNMEAMATRRKYDVVWLSDSNTRVHPDTLADMAQRLALPKVGAVISPVHGEGEQTPGAAFDALQMGALVAFTSFAVHGVTGLVTSPGKSVLMRRETLEAIGGWDELGKYFGEDGVLMERVRGLGLRLEHGQHLVENVAVASSFKKTVQRHLRWSQIRWRIVPFSTPFEPLLMPVLPTTVLTLLAPSRSTLVLLALALCLQLAGDLAVMYRLRGRHLEARFLWLVLARPYVVLWLWARGLFSGRVDWRGNVFWMGPQSMILSEHPLKMRLRALRNAVRPQM
jgi:ceramide glucosyltransferase